MDFNDDSVIAESSDEENPVEDGDTCGPQELGKVFQTSFVLSDEKAVSLKKRYLLHLTNSNDFNTICTSSHSNEVYLMNLNATGLESTTEKPYFIKEKSDICGLKFFNKDPNCLLTGTTDGFINLYDLRTTQKVFSFEDSSEKIRKAITCFDINCNDRILCAGSDYVQAEAFLIFFDIRQQKLLGSYFDSHADNITTIKFHPSNSELMGSGSTDGLINVFDISESTEDDALKYCYNSSSSVCNITWHKNTKDKDLLSCITDTNDFQLYDVEEQDLISEFPRETIAENLKRKSAIDCSLVNCHNFDDGNFCLLATSNFNKGECLRSLKYENEKLIPLADFPHNKQIIRNSVYSNKNEVFVTCGEAGVLSVWRMGENQPQKENKKSKSKSAPHNKKPYENV